VSGAAVPLSTLSLSGIIDGALRQARAHFRRLFLPVALPLSMVNGVLTLANFGATQGRMERHPMAWVIFVLSMAGILVAKALAAAVMTRAALDAVAGRPASAARALAWLLRARTLGTLLMLWAAVAAGLVCCLAPGIYVGVIFALAVPVMAEEGLFGTAALRRSTSLLGYNPARDFFSDGRVKCFVLSFVSWLLGYALTMLLQSPFLIVQQVALFRELAAGRRGDPAQVAERVGWLQVPAAMLGTLGQVAAALYFGCGLALLYFDVRRRREGSDLEAAILSVSGLPPDAVWPPPPMPAQP
jgi:hypothetical protein